MDSKCERCPDQRLVCFGGQEDIVVRAMLRGTSPAMLHQEGTNALPLSESPRLSVSHSEDHYEWKDNITALALTSQGEDTPKVAYKVGEGSQNDESDFDKVDYRIPMKGKEKWKAAVTSESMGEDSERTAPQIETFLEKTAQCRLQGGEG